MELSWLKTFVDAAEAGNFRKTSERLLMSQPNVTVHIKLLEEFLGIPLFKREKNRVALTETVLPYILKSFMRDHPDIELVIHVEEPEEIEELVDTGHISAGLSALPSVRRSVIHETAYRGRLLFIMPRDAYDDEAGPAISVEKALQSAFLFTHHHPVFWDELLLKFRRDMPGLRTMKVTQAHIAKRFIQEGLGMSFLPASMVRSELIEGRLMDTHCDLFPLPEVLTYYLVKEMGLLEREFLERIKAVHFS